MKVLFLSQDGKLGDAIVNTAFVAAMEGAELHVTVNGATEEFWRQDPRIARRWRVAQPGWRDTVRLGLALRRERFDAIVTWQPLRKEKNRLLLWLARPGKVINLRERKHGPVKHKIEDCAEALRQLGRPVPPLRYDVQYPLPQAGLAPPYILLNLCAADAERSLTPEEGAHLLHALRAAVPGQDIVLSCTDDTYPDLAALVRRTGIGRAHNTFGDLGGLMRLCRDAALVISPDTALVHIASAFQTPVIGIYQNNGRKAVQWGPISRRSAVVLSDNPHSVRGFCVATVIASAVELLEQMA